MQPTPLLARCPYIAQVLAAFDTVVGRSRLMRLDAGQRVKPHADIDYYWHHRVRVHIPVVTDPAVQVFCDGASVHMGAGEAWLLNTWKTHSVINASSIARIHLVFDTVGSPAFWDLVASAGGPRFVAFDPLADARFATESYNLPVVMPPSELESLIADALADADAPPDALTGFAAAARRSLREWRAVWAQHSDGPGGWSMYHLLRQKLLSLADALPDDICVRSNGQRLSRVLRARIVATLNTDLAECPSSGDAPPTA